MKFYTEMTDDELLALTAEQIEDCAKLCLVKEGLPLPYPKPEVRTIESFNPEADASVYECLGCYFERREDAEALQNAALKAVTLNYEYMPGSIQNICYKSEEGFRPRSLPSIEQKDVFSHEIALVLKKYFEDKESIEEPIKTWKKVMGKYNEFHSDVYSAIWKAQNRLNEKNERDSYMQECLRLADNDQVIAQRFFEKRFSGTNQSEDASDE